MIKQIDDNIWKKILSASERRSCRRKSKYTNIIESLPSQLLPGHGYHTSCYSNFTAVPKMDPCGDENEITAVITRSHVPSSSKSPGSILPTLCIFCVKKRKKLKNGWESLGSMESKDAEVSLRDAAEIMNNEALLKLGRYKCGEGQDLVAKETRAHHSRRRDYLRNASRVCKGTQSNEQKTLRNQCFDALVSYIRYSVIDMDEPEYASCLLDRLKRLYMERSGLSDEMENYTVQNLCKCIRSVFQDDVLSIQCTSSKRTILYKSSTSLESASTRALVKNNNEATTLINTATYLRDQISKQQPTPLAEPVTVESILRG